MVFDEWGTLITNPNAAKFCQDFFDFCRSKNVGCLQYGWWIPSGTGFDYSKSGLISSYTPTLNVLGDVWASNMGIALNENLAVVPDDWRIGETWNAPTFLEANTAYWHNGHQSIRMEKGTDATKSREILCADKTQNDWSIRVKPGDHIVFKVWMKTAASTIGDTTPGSGIRLGIDFYDGTGSITGIQSPDGSPPTLNGNNVVFPANQYLNYVNWGHDWEQRTMEFVVANQYAKLPWSTATGATGAMLTPDRMIPWVQVWSDTNGNADNGIAWFADAELYINPTSTPTPIYHGVALSKSSYEWNPFTASDYQYLKDLGLNSVQFELWWTQTQDGFEESETNPLNPSNPQAALRWVNVQGLDAAVALAQSYGFTVVLESRVSFIGDGTAGWSDRSALRGKYVNLNNIVDGAGRYGRDRYVTWIKWLAGRYKTCMINPWFFPYHAQTNDANDETVLYGTTLPALVNAIRSAGNNQTICLTLMAQGVTYGTGKNEMGQFSNTRFLNAIATIEAADPLKNIMYMGNNHDGYLTSPYAEFSYMDMVDNPYNPWNQDYAGLSAQLQPAVNFSSSHRVGCGEFAAMVPHTKPMDSTRLAWVRENFRIFKASNLSWWWWRDERVNDITSYDVSALRNPDGTLNEEGLLVKEYATGIAPTLSYPADRWQRLWSKLDGTFLGETPDESAVQFNTNWGAGVLAYGLSDYIQFSSGRTINIPVAGDYVFTVGSDDGVRLWIDDVLVLDQWVDRGYTEDTFTVSLAQGDHRFRLDFYENAGDAQVSFSYTPPMGVGTLNVTATAGGSPINASVSVNGTTGTTPATFQLAAGTYTVTATYQGTTLPAQTITITAGQTTTIELQFTAPLLTLPFYENFANLDRWIVGAGTWTVANNTLTGTAPADSLGIIYTGAGSESWTDYEVSADVVIVQTVKEASLALRVRDNINYYFIGIGMWGHQYSIAKVVNDTHTEIIGIGSSADLVYGQTYKVKAVAIGSLLQLWVDGSKVLETTDASLASGAVGCRIWGSVAQYRNFQAVVPAAYYNVTIDSAPIKGITIALTEVN